MIPTIEQIIEDLLAGTITKAQAINWLHQHAEDAGRDLRDDFAIHALNGLVSGNWRSATEVAEQAYEHADAMLAQREMAE